MAESSDGPYRISCPSVVLARLRTWGQQAVARGRKEAYLDILRTLHEKLTNEPASWGDPQYELKQLGLPVYHVLHRFLQVWYAVDEPHRVVHVMQVRFLSANPLGES